jgi:hypothetical protein
MAGSQTANLTPDLSFGHVSIVFQWYIGIFEPLAFDPYNRSLNIRESTGTPTPKVGIALGV